MLLLGDSQRYRLCHSRLLFLLLLLLSSLEAGESSPLRNDTAPPETLLGEEISVIVTDDESRGGDLDIQRGNISLSADLKQKKVTIIAIILGFCCVGAVILSFVNVHHDYEQLPVFYKGYMGRRLWIHEKKLVSKRKLQEMLQPKKSADVMEDCEKNGMAKLLKLDLTNKLGSGLNSHSMEDLKLDLDSPCSTHTETEDFSISWINTEQQSLEVPVILSPRGGPVSRRYIDDEDPEWRDLDYEVPVCPPPTSFCSFYRQYDWGIFWEKDIDPEDVDKRKALLSQFRKWKKRKRKLFNIVVTERVRREMAAQEEEKNKKVQKPNE